MSTQKQIDASRANGRRSKGPITEQGKFNSAGNSYRHGLLALSIVLKGEHQDRFLFHLNQLMEEHQPATHTEVVLVERLASSAWRLYRIGDMQKAALDRDSVFPDPLAESIADNMVQAIRNSEAIARSHDLLLRYETALDRQFHRALRSLKQIQAERKNSTERPQEQTENKEAVKAKSAPRNPVKPTAPDSQDPAPVSVPKFDHPNTSNNPQNSPRRPI